MDTRDRLLIRTLDEGDLDRMVKLDQVWSKKNRRLYLQRKLHRALAEADVRISLGAELDGFLVGAVLGSVSYGEFGHPEPLAVVDTILVARTSRDRASPPRSSSTCSGTSRPSASRRSGPRSPGTTTTWSASSPTTISFRCRASCSSATSPPLEPEGAPMDVKKLAQMILDVHHTFAHRELATLDAELLATVSDPAFRRAWSGLSNLFRDHMRKEEHVLFPAILAGHTGLDGPIMVMQQEHYQIRSYEKELVRLSKAAGPHERRLLAFLADLSEHARIEDEELFPAVHSPVQIALH